ncbi:MAG: tRNA (N(6)-L-threonylcarbamoyladenosine(37)-C(2))-methylthiotransferase MtaB [Clostridiales bacterium]|nr:tRNA (N(6)-L-threonylcarbamoyladenosine(37)-C(2))-methylthiotransferase MtaB [Clostridiales bacterium]
MNTTNNNTINDTKTVAFHTLGCKVNTYETQGMQKLFEDAGFKVLDFSDKADIYVINTCTVTNLADRKSRQMLHRARKMNEDAIVVAAGCYVQTSQAVSPDGDSKAAEEKDDLKDTVDIIVGNNNKNDIVKIVEEFIAQKEGKNIEPTDQDYMYILDIAKESEFEELAVESMSEKTRASIKIQDGCNQFCSYCIIPYARGRVRSRSVESVINEVTKLTENGYKEVILTGIHLSSYGIDFPDNEDKKPQLLELILDLSKIDKLERIRLSSLEPRIITEEFAKVLSKNPKLCPHFHLSLQSGCDATLKRMNRKYTTKEYKEKCDLLCKYFDNPAITTDVIVGFPGETKEEFEATRRFLEDINFAQMHVFKYSVRKGTVAEKMPNQVGGSIKKERSNILIELENKMRQNYLSSFIGKEEKVLIEEEVEIDGISYQVGHNERYVKIAIESDKDFTNQIVAVRVIKELNDEVMLGQLI